jgi:hypothetical protein
MMSCLLFDQNGRNGEGYSESHEAIADNLLDILFLKALGLIEDHNTRHNGRTDRSD